MFSHKIQEEYNRVMRDKTLTEKEVEDVIAHLLRRQDEHKKGFELAKQLGDFVNIMGHGDRMDGFLDGLSVQHRTLQQSIFSLFLHWVYKMADYSENNYDLRNEYAVLTSKKIKNLLGEYGKGCPFI